MVVTCTIDFDKNPFGTYFAGQTVSGKITLSANKAKKVKGVALKIKGFADTSWSESVPKDSTADGKTTTVTEDVWCSGHEDYLASVTYVLGSNEDGMCTIEPGIHSYHFSCHLPVTCPSSFEGTHGYIRYLAKVALIRPWKFDQTFTKGFTVLKVMDLNYESPLLKMSSRTAVEQTYCCGPCSSDPLKLELNLPQTGFVPGQSIPVEVLILNESRVPVEDIKVVLVMQVVYHADCSVDTLEERIEVSEFKGGEKVLPHCTKRFNYNLYIPATPPTCLTYCRIIQIAYQLEVIAKVRGTPINQTLSVPVTIGNVPLRGGVIQQQPTGTATVQRGYMKAVQNKPTDALTSDDQDQSILPSVDNTWTVDLPPPTYEEALHVLHAKINADEAHDYGQSEFTPRYTVFSLPSPTDPAYADDVDDTYMDASVGGVGNTEKSDGTWL